MKLSANNNNNKYKDFRYTSLIPYTLSLILTLCTFNAFAFDFPAGAKKNSYIDVTVNNIAVEGNQLLTDITFDISNVNLKGNSELVVTPVLFDDNGNQVELESFTIAGRNRFYWLERNGLDKDISLFKGWGKKSKDASQDILNIESVVPYKEWMNYATLGLKTQDLGCANCRKGSNDYPLAETEYVEISYFPDYLYVTPQAEAVKTRDISARAYIDFVVNRTEINPTYRRNPVELAKIQATIDSVRNDKDITITKLHISGTASPEGSYQNNVRLAKGRTESLKDYVQGLYRFPAGVITSSYEPVDWEGLSAFLKQVLGITDKGLGNDSIRQDQFKANSQIIANQENNNSPLPLSSYNAYQQELPHAQQILNIVNGDLEPYARNSKIKSTYPKEYAWLLANVYPALRHSDYRIEFEIKHFTEAPEIIEIMETNPSKLSLEELFVAANSQAPGSELYNRAFQLAVTMYPQDEIANLNAATAAMVRGDLVSAGQYLAKIKNETPESQYAKAMYQLIQGNEDEALWMFDVLSRSENSEVAAKATAAKEGLEHVRQANGFHFRLLQ
ncbi:MAG: DUF3868 domain-containing protein [Muribaculaceae bacterium]|nr:DUF3868 domain-containing protein [Muribaculaceae bacterium]